MKLTFATSSFLGGGITSYAHEVINSFAGKYEMSVIIGDDSKSPINDSRVNVYHVEGSDCSIKNAKYAISLINDDIKPDILLISNSRVIALIAPYLDINIKIITISHSLKYIEADIAAFNHKWVNKIVALSYFNKQYLAKRFHVPQSKFEVIYNFVRGYPDADYLVEKKKNASIPIQIVYVGGSSGAKSPEIVLRILKQLVKTDIDYDFYWVGSDTPPLKKIQLFSRIALLFPSTDKRLHFTGRIGRDEVALLMEKADIIVMPSRREGCPMALLEALRVGTVAIVSDFDNACKEIIRDHYNGFVVDHHSINSFVKTIVSIANNKKAYYKYYDTAYDTYKSQLSFEKWVSSMNDLLSNCSIKNEKKKKFSKGDYYTSLVRLKIYNFSNIFDKFVNESLRSAIPFFWEFLKLRFQKTK